MKHADIARRLLQDIEIHYKNEAFWRNHDVGISGYHRRRRTDLTSVANKAKDTVKGK